MSDKNNENVVWRLQTKTELSVKNKKGLTTTVAEYCIENKVIALGWTLKEDIYINLGAEKQKEIDNAVKNIKTLDDYENIVKKYGFFNGKINDNIRRLTEIKENDFIWLRSKGIYYLGIVKNPEYRYLSNDDILDKLGARNQLRSIEWFEVGDESTVPGCISTSFIQGNTLQRIKKIESEDIYNISNLIYNKKVNNKSNDVKPTIKLSNSSKNFFALLTPNDCEDLLYFYFYNKFKYIGIPSTNKNNTPLYEFVMISSKNREKKIYLQVKNGSGEKSNLFLKNYKHLEGKIYLFTTGGKIFENDENDNPLNEDFSNFPSKLIGYTKGHKKIYAINPEKIYEFAKKAYVDKAILLPQSILQCLDYLE